MISFDSSASAYVAYAMTSFGPSAVSYQGRWSTESTLMFEGTLDSSGARQQRVTYEKRQDGRMRFRFDNSSDSGATFALESELVLERAGGGR